MKIKNRIIEYAYITVGALLLALASTLFFDKVGLVTGGVTGICIIIKSLTNMPLWLSNTLINVPLLIIAIIIEGKKVGWRTLYGTAMLSVWLAVCDFNFVFTDNLLLVALYGGLLAGVGCGLVFRGLGTTGGTDIICVIIKHFFPYVTLGRAQVVIETIIVASGIYFFSVEKALYAVISIYICSKVLDLVLEGTKFGKVVYIISDSYDEISKAIMNDLERGVTCIHATGMYTKDDKKVLMCVVDKKQVPLVKNLSYNIDKNAFIMTCDAREVIGEGFGVIGENFND